MKETNVQQNIRLAVSENNPNTKLFRNNTGKLKDANGRWVEFGLCVGSSDLIGFTTVEITPDMIGQKLAIFTAIEVKTQTGKPTKEQINFINVVRNAGGLAGVARNTDDALKILKL